jgi:hypothetical protein
MDTVPKIFFEETMIGLEVNELKRLAESAHKFVEGRHNPYVFIKKVGQSGAHYVIETIPFPDKLQVQKL